MPAPQSTDEVIALIRPFVGGAPFDADTPLISSGLLDSFSMAELIDAVDSAYGVRLELDEVGVDNADSPRQLLELIAVRS